MPRLVHFFGRSCWRLLRGNARPRLLKEPRLTTPPRTRPRKAGLGRRRRILRKRSPAAFSRQLLQVPREKKQEAGLRLDIRQAAMRGGDEGPVIKPGNADDSKLVAAVRYAGDIQMPPDGKLPSEKIGVLATWVKRGAPWPDHGLNGSAGQHSTGAAENHWAFQPVREPPIPLVKNSDWVRTPIDAFVLARLEAASLAPSQPADRRTLIRRVTLDLTGLPPTPAEVAEFVNDPSPDAYDRLVDRLLASPCYGERWGRFWLDYATLFRHERLCIPGRPQLPVRLCLPRLGHPIAQRGPPPTISS